MRVWPSSTYTHITPESNVALKYQQFVLTNPDRVVVDIAGVHLNSVLKGIASQVHADYPYLKQARVGQFDQHTVRLVLELKHSVSPHIFSLAPLPECRHRLVLDLYPTKGGSGTGMIRYWRYWKITTKAF